MRIALLTSTNSWRGSGVSFGKIGQGLADRGHAVHMITAAEPVTTRFKQQRLLVTEIPAQNTGPREILALHRLVRRTAAEIIMVDTPRDVRLAALATLGRGTRIVYRYNLNSRSFRADFADRLSLRRVAALVFQSSYIRERALREAPVRRHTRIHQIPNGYDLTRFQPAPDAGRAFRAALGLPTTTCLVLSTAKLTRNKGHDVAVDALARVRRDGLDVTYVICGDGDREDEVRARAEAAGLPVRFLGLLDPDQLVPALAAADLFVHPSLEEIFPNAVGEAMACGRPVIAADAGGTAELVGRDGVAGILVPPGDVAALAAATTSLMANCERRHTIAARARDRIAREFPLERMTDAYETALAELLDTSRRR